MSQIAIEVALRHLRMEEDDPSEMVQLYLDAAEDSAQQYLNRSFYATEEALAEAVANETAGDEAILLNPSITAACLLIVGHLYEHREDVIIGSITAKLPLGSQSLLLPYRVGMGI